MKIETKFNEEDEIFFLSNDKVVSSIVRGFKIERSQGITTIIYLFNKEPDQQISGKVVEEKAFASKKALLNSL